MIVFVDVNCQRDIGWRRLACGKINACRSAPLHGCPDPNRAGGTAASLMVPMLHFFGPEAVMPSVLSSRARPAPPTAAIALMFGKPRRSRH